MPDPATDDDLTGLFKRLQAVNDACAAEPVETRMSCLREALGPAKPPGNDAIVSAGNAGQFAATLATGASMLARTTKLVDLIR